MKNNPIFKMIVATGVVFILFALTVACGIYMNFMEYLEISERFTTVFWVDFNVKALTFTTSFVLFFAIILTNFFVLRNTLTGIDASFSYLKKSYYYILSSVVLAIVVSVLSSKMISGTIMPYLNSQYFGTGDPVFYKDIGYYVFQRPFLISVSDVLLKFSGILLISTVLIYLVLYGMFDFYNLKGLFKEKGFLVHVISLIMIFFLIKAVTYKFACEDILFNANNGFTGADYADIKVWLKFYNIIPVVLIIVVVVTTLLTLRQKYKGAILTVMVYPLMFVVTTIIASVVNTIIVDPNEMVIQSEYIQSNINYTRSAYNLDKIVDQDYPIKYDLNETKIMDNLDTINNVRINDFDQTVNILNQLQSLKTYYSFADTDVVTYTLDGEPTAVSIAAREININKLPESAKTYVNTKMRYTHGYGVAVNKMNTVNENGQPNFIVRDMPVISDYDELNISEPRIYYGEAANDYVIVGTKDGESDDVAGGHYAYQGDSGIGLNFFNRLILSVREADFKMLISDQISANSKILLNTNIMDRVKKIAPFLTYDNDPIIVVDDDGSLKWIIDAYTTTQYYPYSEYSGNINYIRNSVKVVIDAYHGTTKFYIVDNTDPIIKSYSNIYPYLFEKESFPATLKEHVRYPMDMFTVQAYMLQKYHITNATEFYQNKGVWSFANEKVSENTTQSVKPYYNFMSVNGEEAELVLMIPYTLANKDNMISWLAVRCTGENYGQMVVYRFNESENISGPYQVENRIDSDSVLSQDISLWESSGSSVIRGNMMVVPIANNLLYVEPIYITSGTDQSSLPQVARIVVSYKDKIVAEKTLAGCFNKLFGVNMIQDVSPTDTIETYIQRVISSYMDVKNYSQNNDWEGFGKAMSEFDKNISNLQNKMNVNEGVENQE